MDKWSIAGMAMPAMSATASTACHPVGNQNTVSAAVTCTNEPDTTNAERLSLSRLVPAEHHDQDIEAS